MEMASNATLLLVHHLHFQNRKVHPTFKCLPKAVPRGARKVCFCLSVCPLLSPPPYPPSLPHPPPPHPAPSTPHPTAVMVGLPPRGAVWTLSVTGQRAFVLARRTRRCCVHLSRVATLPSASHRSSATQQITTCLKSYEDCRHLTPPSPDYTEK